jgi:hypothetical protein
MVKYEVIAKTGTYTNKNGEEKNRWQKCGVVMETSKGLTLKMEMMPFGSDGWFILSEPKPKDAPTQQSQSLADMDSDVQF